MINELFYEENVIMLIKIQFCGIQYFDYLYQALSLMLCNYMWL